MSGTRTARALIFGALATTCAMAPPAMTTPAGAVTSCSTRWTNAAGGDWATPSNWSDGVPTAESVACLNLGGTYTVSIAGWDGAASSLQLGAKRGTQTLDFLPNCEKDAYLTLGANSTIGKHGVVDLEPADGCDASAQFIQNAGTLTNNGLIHALPDPDAVNILQVALINNGLLQLDSAAASNEQSWINNGEIRVADGVQVSVGTSSGAGLVNNGAIDAAGSGSIILRQSTYVQANGTATGSNPVIVQDGQVSYTGGGKSTVVALGRPTTITGNLGNAQTLLIKPSCDEPWATVVANADWTNRGKVVLTQRGLDGCGGNAELEGEVTVTNRGTISTNGSVDLSENVVNDGTLKIGAGTVNPFGAQITNAATGTLSIEIASMKHFAHVYDAVLHLGGTLAIVTADKYWPAAHSTFRIADSGSASGTFASVTGLKRAGQTVKYHVIYAADGLDLTT